ncbi:hypothetical protein [Thalassobellus suaedae]|uniref:Lipoprotein n=1 Tax=Thalassobellus suaedae TaxID=3074124 RepID=A0ABY9XVB4_9FLAO|nr:hypothetical protein RHP51_02310 [Flavobacteriaceae bacterium HL-DH14]
MKTLAKLKHIIILAIIALSFISCTKQEGGCETETVCFGDGNCIEKPIPGTCF